MRFEDYITEHFSVSRVSMGTQLLLKDECPFCGGAGRVYIGRKNESGICFKCQRGFGAISFIMANEGVTKPQAKAILSGHTVGYQDLEEDEDGPENDFSVWFPPTVPLHESPDAMAYLTGRGFGQDIIDRFGLTFCNTNVQIDDKIYWTANRIIIPLFDAAGNAVGWQGRDITCKWKTKYTFLTRCNSSKSRVFSV